MLLSDSDANGDALAVALKSGSAHGSLDLKAGGSFLYTPAAGCASFICAAFDSQDAGAEATVTIEVQVPPVVEPPVVFPIVPLVPVDVTHHLSRWRAARCGACSEWMCLDSAFAPKAVNGRPVVSWSLKSVVLLLQRGMVRTEKITLTRPRPSRSARSRSHAPQRSS